MTSCDLPKFFGCTEEDSLLYYVSKLENFVLDIINEQEQTIDEIEIFCKEEEDLFDPYDDVFAEEMHDENNDLLEYADELKII